MKNSFKRGHNNWPKSAKNTAWCLLGCSIGDNSTVLFYQFYMPNTEMFIVMGVSIFMAIVTSIGLETLVLSRQMPLKEAIKTAFNMSIISMVVMEFSANLVSILWVGGQALILTWQSLIPSWIAGFLSAWPYNYYKLQKHGKSCH